MSSSPENFEQTLHRLGAEASRSLTIHPDYRELAGYCEDALPARTEEAIREHLSHCPACARVVLDLLQPPAAVEVSASERERGWQALLERADSQKGAEKHHGAEASDPLAVRLLEADQVQPTLGSCKVGSHWSRTLKAATFFFALLGGGWLLSQLTTDHSPRGTPPPPDNSVSIPSEPSLTAQPQALTEPASIEPERWAKADGILRGKSQIELRRSEGPSEWGLLPATDPDHDRFQVRIVQGETTFWQAPLQPLRGPEGTVHFSLRLTPSFFPAGRYQIRITGLVGETEQELGRWPLLVQD